MGLGRRNDNWGPCAICGADIAVGTKPLIRALGGPIFGRGKTRLRGICSFQISYANMGKVGGRLPGPPLCRGVFRLSGGSRRVWSVKRAMSLEMTRAPRIGVGLFGVLETNRLSANRDSDMENRDVGAVVVL
jgi:hypothetical protein